MTFANKLLQYDELFPSTDEPRVVLLEGRRNLYKYASTDVHDYCAAVQPQPGKRYVLVLAMSASEYYGPNRNGDAFPERPVFVNGKLAIKAEEVLPEHYLTFESHARPYVHHINSNPEKHYGKVVKAFYNWNMHRVELLIEIDMQLARDQFFLSKIEQGEFPGVSMGCRIPYDVCSICGHQAPKTSDYCEHVNNLDPEYGMNRLLSDGRRCFVYNPSPLLFDISFVFRPADRIGYTMWKVAGEQLGIHHDVFHRDDPYQIKVSSMALGEYRSALQDKSAILRKISEIDKIIDGQTVADSGDHNVIRSFVSNYIPALIDPQATLQPEAARTVIQTGAGLPGFTHAMYERNAVPCAKDVTQIMFASRGAEPTDKMLNAVAGSQGALAGALAEFPAIIDTLERVGLLGMRKSASLEAAGNAGLMGTENNRSLAMDRFFRQHVPESVGVPLLAMMNRDSAPYYADSHQKLTVRDPRSGRTLETNRLAAEEADMSNKKKWLLELAGMSALSGIGLKALHNSRASMLTAPAAIAAAGGVKAMSDFQKVPTLQTEQGINIPLNTELVEKRSSVAMPVMGSGALTMLLAQDKIREFADATPLDGLTDASAENPTAVATGFAATAAGLEEALKQVLRRFKGASHVFPEDRLMPLAAEIGRVIMDYA